MLHRPISSRNKAKSLELKDLKHDMKTRSQTKKSARGQCGQRLVRKPRRAQLKRPKGRRCGVLDVVVAAAGTPTASLHVCCLPVQTELERANRAKQSAFDIRRMRATNARCGLA